MTGSVVKQCMFALVCVASSGLSPLAMADAFSIEHMAKYSEIMDIRSHNYEDTSKISCEDSTVTLSNPEISAASDCYRHSRNGDGSSNINYELKFSSRLVTYKENSYLIVWKGIDSAAYTLNLPSQGEEPYRQFPGGPYRMVFDHEKGPKLKVSFLNRFELTVSKLKNHPDATCQVAYGKKTRSEIVLAFTCSKTPVEASDFTELLKAAM